MRFRYVPQRVAPTPAYPERAIVYRPIIPVRFKSKKMSLGVRALLDTGADESYITESMAERLHLTPISSEVSRIQSASGEMEVVYAHTVIQLGDNDDRHTFMITVGIVSEDWSDAVLGHAGFFEHFDAHFSYAKKIVTLTAR